MTPAVDSDPSTPDSTSRNSAHTVSEWLGTGKRLLHRVELMTVLAAACAVFIAAEHFGLAGSPAGPLEALALGLILVSMYVAFRTVKRYLLAERSHLRALVSDAHIEGGSAVADTVRHVIGNKLAVAVGYSEMLLDDPRLPDDAQEQAKKVFTTSMAAANAMHSLDPRQTDLYVSDSQRDQRLLDLSPTEPETQS